MLDGVPGPLNAQQRKLLVLQRDSADRLGLMIAKLLDLSRLESGLPLSLRPEPIVPLLEAAAEHARAAGAERGVQVSTALPAEEVVVMCDADRVRQLVDNLLENAIKFSPRGALVELGARVVDGPMLQVAVADRGPGIEPEMRDKVFERFFQTSEGRSVPGRGVGLGLTIVRQIAQAHGGGVVVDGREGGGTAFIVRLPGVEVPSGETGEWHAAADPRSRGVDEVPKASTPESVIPATSGVRARVSAGSLVLCLAGLTACSPGRSGFDEHLREGRWTEAVAAFERDSSLRRDPDALRRLADVHAVPQRPEWDPERAASLYAQARAHSRGRWTMPLSSARSAALVEEVLRLRAAHRAQEEQLLARLAQVDAGVAALRAERDSLARVAAASDEEIASRVRTITRLERSLQEREAEARNLRVALDRLKAIDLKPQANP
jgi:anti-sigma regulatory factor (Ser/Thr protein kinase)